ncbi:MAG: polysaccharide biosynthesis protein [Planctomycetia bacterium]|nr:polysaccharide biosynthesis protein [Planctomycetia bacterium]
MDFRSSIRFSLCASWIAHALSILVGFFLMPYVLHTLGKERYGEWIFIVSVTSYTSLMYLGFGEAIKKFVATHHAREEWDKLNQTVNVTFAVYGVTALTVLLTAAVLCCLAPRFRPWEGDALLEVRLVILVLGLNVACGMLGSAFGGVLLGIQRFDLQRGVTVGADLLRVSLTLLVLQADWGLLRLAGVLLIVSMAENVSYLVLAFLKVPTLSIGVCHLTKSALRECFGFSMYAAVGSVAWQLINATDTIIIGMILGAEAIVPYFVALRLSQFIQRPLAQIGEVCMPKAGELHARSDARGLKDLAIRGMSLAFVLAAGIWIGAAFFGEALILTWVRELDSESHTILMVLLTAQLVASPIGILRSIIFGAGDAKTPALMHLAEAVANVILSLILIKPFGILGVALGTTIPILAVELGALLPYACRRLNFGLMQTIGGVLGPQAMPLLALLTYCFWVQTNFEIDRGWSKLVAVTLGGAAVLGIAWGAGFLLRRNARVSNPTLESTSSPVPTP